MNVSRIRLVSSHPVFTALRMGTLVSLPMMSVLYMSPASLARKYFSCFCFALNLASMYFFSYAFLPSFLPERDKFLCQGCGKHGVLMTKQNVAKPAFGRDVAGVAHRVDMKWLCCALDRESGVK